MTRTIVDLHRRLRKRSLKGQKGAWVSIVIVFIYGLAGALSLGFMTFASVAEGNLLWLVIPLGAGVLAYWMISMMMPSTENVLKPGAFAVFPVTGKDIAPGMFLAGWWQSRGLLVILNSVITLGFGAAGLVKAGVGLAPVVVWFFAVVAAAFLSVLGGEALGTLSLVFGKGRSRREKVTTLGGVAFLFVLLGLNVVANMGFDGFSPVALSWTPMGAGAAAVESLVQGNIGWFVLRLILAVFLLPILWWLYRINLNRSLSSVLDSAGPAAAVTSHSVEVRGISNPVVSTLIARQLRYFRRDGRWLLSMWMVTLFPLFFVGLGWATDNTAQFFTAVAILVIFSGSVAGNMIGADGPPNWLHIVAGVSGRALLLSKVAAAAMVVVPSGIVLLVALGVIESLSLTWVVYAVLVISGIIGGFGTSCFLMTRNAFPMGKPGTNAFRDPSANSSNAIVASFSSLALPGIPLIITGVLMGTNASPSGSMTLFIIGAVLSLVIAVGLAIAGFQVSSRWLDRHWPELFTKINHYL